MAKHTSWTIKFLLSPPPTNFTVEKKNEKRNKTKNEWCYLLLTYVLHCKKKKKTRPWSPPNKTLSRLTTTTDWPYQFVLAFKTVHYSAQHFLNFFVKQHHHRSRHWQQQQQIWDILIENQNNNKYSSSKCTYREDGVWAWPKTTGHAPPFTEIIRNGRRNTTTNHYYYKNTNVIMIVFCCLILIFFW